MKINEDVNMKASGTFFRCLGKLIHFLGLVYFPNETQNAYVIDLYRFQA